MGACRRPSGVQQQQARRGAGRQSAITSLSSPRRPTTSGEYAEGESDSAHDLLWRRRSTGILSGTSEQWMPWVVGEADAKEANERPQSTPSAYRNGHKVLYAGTPQRPPSAGSKPRTVKQPTRYSGPKSIGDPTLAFGLPRPCGSYGFVERAVTLQGANLWKHVRKPPRSSSQPSLILRHRHARPTPAWAAAPKEPAARVEGESTNFSTGLAEGQKLPTRAQIALHLGVRVGPRIRSQWGVPAIAEFLADQWQQDVLEAQLPQQEAELQEVASTSPKPLERAAWEAADGPDQHLETPKEVRGRSAEGDASPAESVPRGACRTPTSNAGARSSVELVGSTFAPKGTEIASETSSRPASRESTAPAAARRSFLSRQPTANSLAAFTQEGGQRKEETADAGGSDKENNLSSTANIEEVLKFADDVLNDASEFNDDAGPQALSPLDLKAWEGKTGTLKAVLTMRRELEKARKRLDKTKRRESNRQRAIRMNAAASGPGSRTSSFARQGLHKRRTTILQAARSNTVGSLGLSRGSTLRELQQTYEKYNTNAEEIERLQRWESVFSRMQRDGEVHTDDLRKALELAGFMCPEASVIASVVIGLTQYSTLDFEEFCDFIEAYEAREYTMVAEAFKEYDTDNSGVLELQEVSALFAARGITPMPEVISAIAEEVGVENTNEFHLEELRKVMETLRVTAGFTREEVDKCRETFKRYDRDESADLSVQELVGALSWLGFVQSRDDVDDVLETVGLQEYETLQWHEFLFSVRRVKEVEISKVRKLVGYEGADVTIHVIPIEEVERVLVSLQYFPNSDAVQETLEEVNVHPEQTHLTLAEFWRVLELYRTRDGFTKEEHDEIRAEFDRAAHIPGATEINSLYLGRVLRGIGYATRWEMQQRMVQEADLDMSGSLDFNEVVKVVRKLREAELVKVQQIFYRNLPEGKQRIIGKNCKEALRQLGFNDVSSLWKQEGRAKEGMLVLALLAMQHTLAGKGDGLTYAGFASLVVRMMNARRRALVKSAGWSEGELAELKAVYQKYDEDGNGVIKHAEMRTLLADFFPQQLKTPVGRGYLKDMMKEIDQDGNEELDFQEFTLLVRQFNTGIEEAYLTKEREAIDTTKFNPQEVEAFRDIFLGHDKDTPRMSLAFHELKQMLSDIIPMGAGHLRQLWQVFEEFSSSDLTEGSEETRTADFPDFLLLMRSLLGINFAGIASLEL